jgi:hypothetical protein
MIRALGAPAALAVLIGVQVLFMPSEPEKPTPAKGALTIDLEGSEGSSDQPFTFLAVANGDAPTDDAVLKDTTGEQTGTVGPGDCPDDAPELVAIPGGAQEWCLQATKIAVGHELAGDVTGTGGEKITFTVRRRDAFWPGPALWLVAGLLAGLAVILVPERLRRLVRWIVLNQLLAKNRHAGKDEICALEDWARRRLAAGVERDDVIAAVNEMVSSGPSRAAAARRELSEALAKTTLPAEHKYLAPARAMADPGPCSREMPCQHTVGDFYDEEGEPAKQHPAAEWLAGLERLEAHAAELARRKKEIEDDVEPDDRAVPEEELAQARTTFAAIDEPKKVEWMTKRLDDLRTAVEDARAKSLTDDQRRFWRAARGPAEGPAEPRGALETVIPLGLSASTLVGWATLAKLVTLLVLVPAIAFAIVTAKTSAFDPKLTFDSFTDYFGLFSAALGSGLAASALALFGYWSASKSEPEG